MTYADYPPEPPPDYDYDYEPEPDAVISMPPPDYEPVVISPDQQALPGLEPPPPDNWSWLDARFVALEQAGGGCEVGCVDLYADAASGDLFAQTGTTVNPYLYTGQRFDAATAQYYLRAREYDPAVGRFLSRDTWAVDTWNPIELNRYVYAAANPVTWSDPSGRMAETAAINMQVATVDIYALLVYSAALTCIYYFQTISLMELAGVDTTFIRAAAPDGCKPPPKDEDEEEDDCPYTLGIHKELKALTSTDCHRHHPVNSVWMDAHYKYDEDDAWVILMPAVEHAKTFAVFNTWRYEMTGNYYGKIDWKSVSYSEVKKLAELQLAVTGTPGNIISEYWVKFEEYRQKLTSR